VSLIEKSWQANTRLRPRSSWSLIFRGYKPVGNVLPRESVALKVVSSFALTGQGRYKQASGLIARNARSVFPFTHAIEDFIRAGLYEGVNLNETVALEPLYNSHGSPSSPPGQGVTVISCNALKILASRPTSHGVFSMISVPFHSSLHLALGRERSIKSDCTIHHSSSVHQSSNLHLSPLLVLILQ